MNRSLHLRPGHRLGHRPGLSLGRALALLSLLAGALVTIQSTQATAADELYRYRASAGGTHVKAVGGTIRSGLTSPSGLGGSTYPASAGNRLAGAGVGNLLRVGAVETAASASRSGGVDRVRADARTAGVSLLDGLIEARAVTTSAVAERDGASFSGGSRSTLLGLTIAGRKIPLAVKRNFKLTVPGIASVVLNESVVDGDSAGIMVTGSAIKVTLLDDFGRAPVGSTIVVNPTSTGFVLTDPTDVTPVGGFAYGTAVSADAANLARAGSGPTALTTVPDGGTSGRPIVNSTAAADVPRLVSAGVVESSSAATSVPVTAEVENRNVIKRLNLLNGLVTADAVRVVAHASKRATGPVVTTASTELVGLQISGIKVRPSVRPNSTIGVPGLLKVSLNEQVETANGITVIGLRVKLRTAIAGLPAGAEIHVAVASSRAG